MSHALDNCPVNELKLDKNLLLYIQASHTMLFLRSLGMHIDTPHRLLASNDQVCCLANPFNDIHTPLACSGPCFSIPLIKVISQTNLLKGYISEANSCPQKSVVTPDELVYFRIYLIKFPTATAIIEHQVGGGGVIIKCI